MIFGDEYRAWSSSLCSLLHSPVTSPLLGPNILNTLFSKTLSLHSILSVGDQVSHPHKTTEKIIFLYILSCIFLDSKLEDKIFYHPMKASIPRLQSALNLFVKWVLCLKWQHSIVGFEFNFLNKFFLLLSVASQAGRSRFRCPLGSMRLFIYLILPAALWLWVRLRLWEKWVPGIFPRE